MIAATAPVQRSPRAKVMVVDPSGQIRHLPRPALIELIQPGDLVVANDAATIPASLSGVHLPSDRPIEVRLAGVPSLDPHNREFSAVVFGEGDFHTRTEDRPRSPRSLRVINFRWPPGGKSPCSGSTTPASFCSSSITLETSFGLAWLITADLSSTRMFRFLLPFGMCGHPSRG